MATCAGFVEPLNLQCLLINIFSGNGTIFVFLSIFILAGIAARFQMRDEVVLMALGVYTFIIAQFERGLVVLFVVLTAIITYTALKRPVSRQ